MQESSFDWEQYITPYTMYGKIRRLYFLGKDRSIDDVKDALLEEVKASTGGNSLLKYIVGSLPFCSESDLETDVLEKREAARRQRKEVIDGEIQNTQKHPIKESMRMTYNDAGDYYYWCGDFKEALKRTSFMHCSYMKTKDFCGTTNHVLFLSMQVIKTAIELENYPLCAQYVNQAESHLMSTVKSQKPNAAVSLSSREKDRNNEMRLKMLKKTTKKEKTDAKSVKQTGMSALLELPPETRTELCKIRAAGGLCALMMHNIRQAANRFTSMTFDLGESFSDVISSNDVALYGTLCAMASYERPLLKRSVIDNTQFKQYLEIVPEVREFVNAYYGARYVDMLKAMKQIRNMVHYDVYLSPISEYLFQEIRKRALIQYTLPFTTVKLDIMAEAFQTSFEDLCMELATLIASNDIHARIDKHDRILYANDSDERESAIQKVIQTHRELDYATVSTLRKLNISQHKTLILCTKDSLKAKGRSEY